MTPRTNTYVSYRTYRQTNNGQTDSQTDRTEARSFYNAYRIPLGPPRNNSEEMTKHWNNNNNGRKLADQSGDDREISFLFQRLSVLIQRYNAILLHDCFVKEEEK